MSPHDLILTPRGVRFMGRLWPCTIGRGGIRTHKAEGDGATPTGTHRIVGMLYRPDRMEAPARWAVPIGPTDLWSDDPADPSYNQMVRAPYAPSHEALHRADPLYDLVLLTNWNYPVSVPNRGSAIFVHRWRKPRHPTEGCVAFSAANLLWIAQRTSLGTRLIVKP